MIPQPPTRHHRALVERFVQDGVMDDGTAGHELLDIGDERRLERFGSRILDRPTPGEGGFPRRDPAAWNGADARFDRDAAGDGRWTTIDAGLDGSWPVRIGEIVLELRLAASGQVGCFPEQAPIWRWVTDRIRELALEGVRPAVLNLFAHTGAATIAAASAGASVVHVDASRPAIAWARTNAGLNASSGAPIRWIAEDAVRFVAREARRDRRYDGLILDPPSFGHGLDRRAWRLVDDLPDLLTAGVALLGDGPAFVVLSAHTPGFGAERLGDALRDALGQTRGGRIETAELGLEARSGRRLALGAVARWTR